MHISFDLLPGLNTQSSTRDSVRLRSSKADKFSCIRGPAQNVSTKNVNTKNVSMKGENPAFYISTLVLIPVNEKARKGANQLYATATQNSICRIYTSCEIRKKITK